MKRLLVVLLFLIIPFFISPSSISAQTPTITPTIIAPTPTPIVNSNPAPQPSLWEQFWNWILSFFIKDYDIPLDISGQKSTFTSYGNTKETRNENINSAENRSTSEKQQLYFKGRYIYDVVNDLISDKVIAKICSQKFYRIDQAVGSCQDFTIKNLAYYFVKDNQTFLYKNQNGQKEDLGQLISKINVIETLPEPEFSKYKDIYLNFFRVPPEYNNAVKNENATRILRIPIPEGNQSDIPTDTAGMEQDIKAQQKQLNQNFIPEGVGWSGLKSLRPEAWAD